MKKIIKKEKAVLQTYEATDESETDCPNDETRVPIVISINQGDSQVEENYAIAGGAQHLDKVLDGDVRFLGDVLEGVMGLDEAAADQADDAGPVEELGRHVGQVRHAKHGQRLHD